MIKVLIADDHVIIRRGVMDILRESTLPLYLDEAKSAEEALKAGINGNYNIILLDISFPDGNGLEVFNEIIFHGYPALRYGPVNIRQNAYLGNIP